MQRARPLRGRRPAHRRVRASRPGRRPTRRRSPPTSRRRRPSTVLALVGGELKKDAPLAKAVAPHGEVLVWDVPQRGLERWVAEQFKLRSTPAEPRGLPASRRARRGRSLRPRRPRSTSSPRGRPAAAVTTADVEALVRRRAESPPLSLTDAWGAATSPPCCAPPSGCSSARGDPRSRTIPRVVGSLTNHVGRAPCRPAARRARVSRQRRPRRDSSSHPFYVREALRAGRGTSAPTSSTGRHGPARRARPRAQGRLSARERARARAGARRDHAALRPAGGRADGRVRPGCGTGGQTRGLRLLACAGVPVQRAAGDGTVDQLLEAPVLRLDRRASPSSTAVARRFVSVLIVER